MTLTLHFHPLSSFCQKVLTALYEHDVPFERHILDLGDAGVRAAFAALWPIGRMPVLRDDGADRTIPESNIIIEYLDQHHRGAARLIPADPDLALDTRLRDRFFDLYVNDPVGKIVTDKLRPPGAGDAIGVERARALLRTACDMLEPEMASRTWAMGDAFTMADCAAAPALYYANRVQPFGDTHPHLAAYLTRLLARPSFARAITEATPYFPMFPG